MSAGAFWAILALIAVVTIVLTIAGVLWASGPPAGDEPTEHGDGEL